MGVALSDAVPEPKSRGRQQTGMRPKFEPARSALRLAAILLAVGLPAAACARPRCKYARASVEIRGQEVAGGLGVAQHLLGHDV